MKINISIVLGLFFMCISIVLAKADGFKEGKWSMTMVTHMDQASPEMTKVMQQMQNMPPQVQAQMQAMMKAQNVQMNGNGQDFTVEITQCLTKQSPVPHNAKDDKMDKYCQRTYDFQGNALTFHVACNHGDLQMESSGNVTYTGDTMQGHVKSHHLEGGKPVEATIDITGQYLGVCDK